MNLRRLQSSMCLQLLRRQVSPLAQRRLNQLSQLSPRTQNLLVWRKGVYCDIYANIPTD